MGKSQPNLLPIQLNLKQSSIFYSTVYHWKNAREGITRVVPVMDSTLKSAGCLLKEGNVIIFLDKTGKFTSLSAKHKYAVGFKMAAYRVKGYVKLHFFSLKICWKSPNYRHALRVRRALICNAAEWGEK